MVPECATDLSSSSWCFPFVLSQHPEVQQCFCRLGFLYCCAAPSVPQYLAELKMKCHQSAGTQQSMMSFAITHFWVQLEPADGYKLECIESGLGSAPKVKSLLEQWGRQEKETGKDPEGKAEEAARK